MLRVDRTAMELGEILGNYPDVILRYISAEQKCPKRETSSPQIQSALPSPSRTNELPPLPDTVYEPEVPEKHEHSPFQSILQELTLYRMKPEVILLKHKEIQEDDGTDTDNTDNDDTSSPEGDSE